MNNTNNVSLKKGISKIYRVTIFLIAFLMVAPAAFACEICGCGNNNFQIGILPTFSRGFFGLRYSSAQFHSSMREGAGEFSRDYYRTTEIWGGMNLGKFQVMAFLPYFSARRVSDDGTTSSNGLGDAMMLVNYKVLNKVALSRNEKTTMRNEIFFGGGIKLPTGVSRVDTKTLILTSAISIPRQEQAVSISF